LERATRRKGQVLINKAFAKIFGTSNERQIKRMMPVVEQINVLEPQVKQLSDEQLRAKTDEFKAKIREHLAKFEEP
jgi:preprotein translocase subunit SecA